MVFDAYRAELPSVTLNAEAAGVFNSCWMVTAVLDGVVAVCAALREVGTKAQAA